MEDYNNFKRKKNMIERDVFNLTGRKPIQRRIYKTQLRSAQKEKDAQATKGAGVVIEKQIDITVI